MEFVRTPKERFANLAGFPFQENYVELDGLRMHYIDEGSGPTILLLHGEPSWSFLYRHMISSLTGRGYRVLAPDLIGFGKSDKPINREDYTYNNHVKWLETFLHHLKLTGMTLFCQDWGGLLGLRLVAYHPQLFDRVIASNTFLPTGNEPFPEAFTQWRDFAATSESFNIGKVLQKGSFKTLTDNDIEAYNAPFPDESHKMGARTFPSLVPSSSDNPDGIENQKVWGLLAGFTKPFMTAFGADDPITRSARKIFPQIIPGCKDQKHLLLEKAGHFIQEDQPEELSKIIDGFIRSN